MQSSGDNFRRRTQFEHIVYYAEVDLAIISEYETTNVMNKKLLISPDMEVVIISEKETNTSTRRNLFIKICATQIVHCSATLIFRDSTSETFTI